MTAERGFWLSCALVLVNVGLAFFAPLQELRENAVMTGGISALAALMFWAQSHKAEP